MKREYMKKKRGSRITGKVINGEYTKAYSYVEKRIIND